MTYPSVSQTHVFQAYYVEIKSEGKISQQARQYSYLYLECTKFQESQARDRNKMGLFIVSTLERVKLLLLGILTDKKASRKEKRKQPIFFHCPLWATSNLSTMLDFSSLMFFEEENNCNINSTIKSCLLSQMIETYEGKKEFLLFLVNTTQFSS